MIIPCPHCGERDLREFQYLGSAKLLDRPKRIEKDSHEAKNQTAFHDYIYIRENKEGRNAELWLHEAGCRSWLHIIRDTKTHEIFDVQFARALRKAKK